MHHPKSVPPYFQGHLALMLKSFGASVWRYPFITVILSNVLYFLFFLYNVNVWEALLSKKLDTMTQVQSLDEADCISQSANTLSLSSYG